MMGIIKVGLHVYRNMRCKYNVKLPVGEFNLYRIKRYIVISDIVLCDVDVMYFHRLLRKTGPQKVIVISDISY